MNPTPLRTVLVLISVITLTAILQSQVRPVGTGTRGPLVADTLCLDLANQDACLSRAEANVLQLAAGDSLAFTDGTAAAPSRRYALSLGLGSYRIGADNEGFSAGGVLRWDYNAARMFLAEHLLFTDNTYDIGAAGATRPRDIYSANDVSVGRALNVGGTVAVTVGRIQAAEGIYAANTAGHYWASRGGWSAPADGTLRAHNTADTGFTNILYGLSGGATSINVIQKKVTGIADNIATDVFTVTIPNANHAASIRLHFLSSNGSTDAFESSRTASGMIVVARTTGTNAIATAAAIDDAAIATVTVGATQLLTYGVSAISGAAGASNTFNIQVTIDDSGNLGSNQVMVVAELLNAEATGITIN